MPHAMFTALGRRELDVVDLGRLDGRATGRRFGIRRLSAMVAGRVAQIRTRLGDGEVDRWRRDPAGMGRRFEARCRRLGKRLAAAIDRCRPDVLFGNCISSPIAFLDREIPIVYSSDATAEVISSTYPRYAALGASYAAVTDAIERRALAKVRFAALASPATCESAVAAYGLPRDRARVVGFGANVRPLPGEVIDAEAPSRERLRLSITAADPRRKRVSLAVEAVGELRHRGWNASLVVIGPRCPEIGDRPGVHWSGRVDQAVATETARHRRILAESHLCLLPSSGEAYGIAPIESAAFGRPAVVTHVGGLPFVVRDGVTGRVVPREVEAAGLADAIEEIVADPETYRSMCTAARHRAERELHWDRWAAEIESLLRTAAAEASVIGRGASDRS